MARVTLPSAFRPMLATAGTELPRGTGWTYEPKWDGMRIIATVDKRRARLWTRNGNEKSAQFPEVADALVTIAAERGPVVLDGELIAVDSGGAALRFGALQGRIHATRGVPEGRAVFVAFDCLAVGDETLVREPWMERRAALEEYLDGLAGGSAAAARGNKGRAAGVRLGETSRTAGRLLQRARAQGWEGLIAKDIDAPYHGGARSNAWVKHKLEARQEFVVGGFTAPEGGRTHLGALLVGYHDGGALRFAGAVGTGFDRATLADLARRLAPLNRRTSPFEPKPAVRGATWVTPSLVVEVRYNEMTDAGKLRQPVFIGLRDDKRAAEVTLETQPARRRRSA
ncbi:MAG: ATP-dependent DNA ligase [Gemmatimonadaceae bacterium]|nr:ATP-dependent DNA ligase [Gemmatimonadaceae bacterium]